MTADQITDSRLPDATVEIDGIHIRIWIDLDDQEGADFLRSKRDDAARVQAVETAFRVGLRALSSADHTVTERLLDEKLARIVEQATAVAETTLARASHAFEERWTKRIDEELAARLEAHRILIEGRLTTLFGEGSDKSVQASILRFLADYQAIVAREITEDRVRLRRELSELLNGTGDADHPLTRISAQIADLRRDIAVEIEAARAASAAQQVRKDSAKGGYDYQDQTHAILVDVLAGSDDEVELMGRRPGVTGGADGDIVITVDPKLTSGVEARVAVEVTKQSAGLSVTKLKGTLRKAMVDRDAKVAVIVIRDPKVLGGQRLQFFAGLGCVVVWEPDEPVEYRDLPLLVAIKHARTVAIRECRPVAAGIDHARIESATEQARKTIGELSIVLTSQARIIKLAEETTSATNQIQRAVIAALVEIEDAITE